MKVDETQTDWKRHYPSWIIADGEPDFAVGDVFDWYAVDVVEPDIQDYLQGRDPVLERAKEVLAAKLSDRR